MIAPATDEVRFSFELALAFALAAGEYVGRRKETTAILFRRRNC